MQTATAIRRSGRIFRGNVLAPGLGQGPAFVYRPNLDHYGEGYDIARSAIAEESKRLDRAAARIIGELEVLGRRVSAGNGSAIAAVFRAHRAMVQDPVLRAEVKKEIEGERVSAEKGSAN